MISFSLAHFFSIMRKNCRSVSGKKKEPNHRGTRSDPFVRARTERVGYEKWFPPAEV
jgi:hypothetical protein